MSAVLQPDRLAHQAPVRGDFAGNVSSSRTPGLARRRSEGVGWWCRSSCEALTCSGPSVIFRAASSRTVSFQGREERLHRTVRGAAGAPGSEGSA
jgi:hypothetical protein